jgi:hypothetical protein
MAADGSSLTMLDWAAQVHDPSCAGFGPPSAVETFTMLDAIEDEVAAYGLEARLVYSALKRLIGQAAGLMILLEASNRREALDLVSLVNAEELFQEARQRLGRLHAPSRLEQHFTHLAAAGRLVGASLMALRQQRDAVARPDMTAAIENLSAAYRHLQTASEDRFGMTMVDFRHSCCNCGAEYRQKQAL